MKDLRDEVVLLTGATGSLGRAAVPMFLAAGAHVVITGRSEAVLREIASSAGAQDRILAVPADLAKAGAPGELFAAANRWRGRVDGLVQAAGFNECNAFADESNDLFDRLMRVNLTAPAELMKAVLPGMLERGRGVILNVCSIMGLMGYPEAPGYTASKFGLVGLTQALHQEVCARGVRVSAVCPPSFESPMFRKVKNRPAYFDTVSPMTPGHVARSLLAFYGSPRSVHVMGLVTRVSVGLHAVFPELTNTLIRRVIGY